MKKDKRIFVKKTTSPKQHLNPFVKAGMYVFLFVIIPALFVDLNLKIFTLKEAFMPGILFLIFLLSKGYIWASCLKLTNKWYLRIDAFFIVFFAGIYIIGFPPLHPAFFKLRLWDQKFSVNPRR